MEQVYDEEVGKHLKKKDSNKSKSKEKSKHKHNYEECLLRYKFNFKGATKYGTYIASYCTICGKVGDHIKNGTITKCLNEKDMLSVTYEDRERIYEEYKDKIPVFEVDDIFQKFVPVNNQ